MFHYNFNGQAPLVTCLRSASVARLAAGIIVEASMNSLPLPLETTTGALDAALIPSSVGTPHLSASCARQTPFPYPFSYPNNSIPSPQEKTDDNAMTPWGCPRDDVTHHSLVGVNRAAPL